ncbi:MAG: Maf family protein [Myxococcota bacterium]
MRRLILASTSPYRRALLDRLDVPYEVHAPGVDEGAYRDLPAREMALVLSVAKAEAVDIEDALVIGSDQVVDVDGQILGKPGTPARAVEQLMMLSGRAHRLITGVAVHDTRTGETVADVDVHTLLMRDLAQPALERYVAHDNPVDCAGSYKLEQRGIALFERIEADPEMADDTAIVGLPMMKLLGLLRRCGVDVLGE